MDEKKSKINIFENKIKLDKWKKISIQIVSDGLNSIKTDHVSPFLSGKDPVVLFLSVCCLVSCTYPYIYRNTPKKKSSFFTKIIQM